MGYMKDFDRRIRQGGDDAIEALTEYVAMFEPKWIPVEERLPERYIRVLAWVKCDPHEHPHGIGFIGSMGFWSLDELRHDPSAEVTHWMPLPEPPEVK